MLRAHPEIEPVEYPFIDTYYFGQEPMTVRSNDRFEAAKQRLRASPLLAQNYQAAFDELEQAIRKAEGVVNNFLSLSLTLSLSTSLPSFPVFFSKTSGKP